MGDAQHSADDPASPYSFVSVTTRKAPSLRRVSGLENMSQLRVVNVSPETERKQHLFEDELDSSISPTPGAGTFYSFAEEQEEEDYIMSRIASPEPPSVFDIAEEPQDEKGTENTTGLGLSKDALAFGSGDEEEDSYNLKPPPPAPRNDQNNIETLTERLFSPEHLNLILKDYALAFRFTRFVQTYRNQFVDTLKQYTEARKAVVAVEYANSLANRMRHPATESPLSAATLDPRFEAKAKETVGVLVDEALPAYFTHRLVSLVTDTLVKEITGNSAPIISELIPSLAEVYCISDPSASDNPIVYASEEFYNLSQYTPEYSIGRNCRFLQGPKSSESSVRRLIQAISNGEECCETILNYKKDGTPFMNLLMIAPLFDNKGSVRYFFGAQIDVSSLIEGGRGLDSFAQLLSQDRQSARGNGVKPKTRDPHTILGDLGQLFTEEESDIVKNRTQHAPPPPTTSDRPQSSMSFRSHNNNSHHTPSKNNRIILGMDHHPNPSEPRNLWPSAHLGSNGRLPGVYQKYLLVRPYPSLRITFTSPSLRIPGLLQTKLLDRIGGPTTFREGLEDALSQGKPVTAKVLWLTNPHLETEGGRARWLHCTPLLGSDERVGVWCVVVVDGNENAVHNSSNGNGDGRRENNGYGIGSASRSASQRTELQGFTSQKLYADYLKRDGRESRAGAAAGGEEKRPGTQETSTSTQSKVDKQFKDF